MLWLNPDTHTSGSLLAAVLQLNWLQRSGSSTEFPPGTTQLAKTAVAGLPTLHLMNLGMTPLPSTLVRLLAIRLLFGIFLRKDLFCAASGAFS